MTLADSEGTSGNGHGLRQPSRACGGGPPIPIPAVAARLAAASVRARQPVDAADAPLPAQSGAGFEYANMVGASPAMRLVYEEIAQVARTNATTLIRGESGTGKELIARAIHNNSERAS